MESTLLRSCVLDGHRGVVRYVGEVPPTEGIWLGVEWDERRGKHDGSHNGTKYFDCPFGHGSFVRPQKVSQGIDVIAALDLRYGIQENNEEETLFVSGTKQQKTAVETVGFEKIQRHQSQFDKLNEVGLAKMEIRGSEQSGSLNALSPKALLASVPNANIKHLDISSNLLSFVEDVLNITSQLKKLERIDISDNRIQFSTSLPTNACCLGTVRILHANRLKLDWSNVHLIRQMAPNVTELHLCFNKISAISVKGDIYNSLQFLNLEGNNIENWNEVQDLSPLPQLQRLILNDNKIAEISFPVSENAKRTNNFQQLTSLSLNANKINGWQSINELNKLQSLTELRFKKNPVVGGMTSFDARQEVIARIHGISNANGSMVTEKERKSSEISFLKKYSRNWANAGGKDENSELSQDFLVQYPRYIELIRVHGIPQIEHDQKKTLKENMLLLTFRCPDDKTKRDISKSVPETMSVQQLKRLVQKLMKVNSSQQRITYVSEKTNLEVDMEDNMRQLSYYSIATNDTVLVRW